MAMGALLLSFVSANILLSSASKSVKICQNSLVLAVTSIFKPIVYLGPFERHDFKQGKTHLGGGCAGSNSLLPAAADPTATQMDLHLGNGPITRRSGEQLATGNSDLQLGGSSKKHCAQSGVAEHRPNTLPMQLV